MGKTVIAPIVAVVALVIQLIFGIEIPDEVINEVVLVLGNAVAIGTVLYGIFKNHKK